MEQKQDTIFSKIIARKLPAEIVYEDDRCLAFRDNNPQAPIHILVIPKEPVTMLSAADSEHAALLGHLLLTASKVAKSEGAGDAFRVVINNGADAGQTVFHLHLHIMAGRRLAWPPG